MDEITLRDFRREDLERIIEISVAAWEPIFDGFRSQMGDELYEKCYPEGVAVKRRHLQEFAAVYKQWIVVACNREGKIAGFATYMLDSVGKVGIIRNNAVDKSMGLKGVGQALYQELFRRFVKAGMKVAQVTTGNDEAHAPARRAYLRAGFGTPVESVTYHKIL